MLTLLNRLTIRMKLWIGFGLVLAILSISSALTLISLGKVGNQVNEVVERRQPTLTAAKDLAIGLNQAAASLGFYLLTKETLHRDEYARRIAQAKAIVQRLKGLPAVRNDDAAGRQVDKLNSDLQRFESIGEKLLGEHVGEEVVHAVLRIAHGHGAEGVPVVAAAKGEHL